MEGFVWLLSKEVVEFGDKKDDNKKNMCLLQFISSTADTICLFPISFLISLKEKYKSASWFLWPF
jgi:hypothetical protein